MRINYYNGFTCVIFILITFFSCSKSNNSDIKYLNKKNEVNKSKKSVQFNDIFEANLDFLFNGTKGQPLYTVRDFLAYGDKYYVLDKKNNQVLVFNHRGKIINRWGKKGRGPGEFLSPEQFIRGADSTLWVLDGSGNFRAKQFSMSGQNKDVLPLHSYGPFTSSYYIEMKNKPFLVITTISRCSEQPEKSCIIQVENMDGNIEYSFAQADKVDPNRIGLPFYSTLQKNRVYIINAFDSKIAVFSINGKYMGHLALQDSPSIKHVNKESLPSNELAKGKELIKRSYTNIMGLYSNNDHIILQYSRHGPEFEDAITPYFLEFYDFQGNLIYTGINTQNKLAQVDGNRFYFVDYDAKTKFGKLRVNVFDFISF